VVGVATSTSFMGGHCAPFHSSDLSSRNSSGVSPDQEILVDCPRTLPSGLLSPAQAAPLTSAPDLAPTTGTQASRSTGGLDRGHHSCRGARQGGPRSALRGDEIWIIVVAAVRASPGASSPVSPAPARRVSAATRWPDSGCESAGQSVTPAALKRATELGFELVPKRLSARSLRSGARPGPAIPPSRQDRPPRLLAVACHGAEGADIAARRTAACRARRAAGEFPRSGGATGTRAIAQAGCKPSPPPCLRPRPRCA
jgi:hypothetical protein